MLTARDVMTSDVVTVAPNTPIQDLAATLIDNQISAVPVVDLFGILTGIVSEGDLMRRVEIETDGQVKRGLSAFFADQRKLAKDYVKSHAKTASEVMVTDVICVGPDTPLSEITKLFAEHSIKRVPVTEGTRLLGIVSRSDLVTALANYDGDLTVSVKRDDEKIRQQLLERLDRDRWLRPVDFSIFVNDGVVQLWGRFSSDEECEALRVAAATVPGVVEVEEHFTNTRGLSYL